VTMIRLKELLFVFALASSLTSYGVVTRVRDLTYVFGAQDNQLFGIGLVSGLNNDGDKNLVSTLAAFANTLQQFGISLPPQALSSKNVALVQITAEIPAYAKQGSKINVLVAAMGDAKSLQGGVLMQTYLFGVDKQIYAMAQGPVTVGGFSLGNSGGGGANVQKNHPTTARIINGGEVVQPIPVNMVRNGAIDLILREGDFTTAARMAAAINTNYSGSSYAVDARTVRVKVPDAYQTPQAQVEFVAQLQAIELNPDTAARIVINERTGTILITGRVKISVCAISHGNIVVRVAESLDVSQPSPFSTQGTTQVVPRTDTQVTEDQARLKAFPDMITVDRIADHLNSLGATPRDLMAIFQLMKDAGSLQAELLVQ